MTGFYLIAMALVFALGVGSGVNDTFNGNNPALSFGSAAFVLPFAIAVAVEHARRKK